MRVAIIGLLAFVAYYFYTYFKTPLQPHLAAGATSPSLNGQVTPLWSYQSILADVNGVASLAEKAIGGGKASQTQAPIKKPVATSLTDPSDDINLDDDLNDGFSLDGSSVNTSAPSTIGSGFDDNSEDWGLDA